MNTVSMSLDRPRPARRGLNASLWITQLVLAGMFGMAGVMKSSLPLAELAKTLAWTADVPGPLVRFIGAAELAGALGLLLPALLRARPVLTPLAAIGLAVVMVLAAGFHVMRGEFALLGMPIALGTLAAFLAWGRLRAVPITARGRG
jgi:putative oxidoreductase